MSRMTPLPSKKVIKALKTWVSNRLGRKVVIYFYDTQMEELQ
jgi:hypothetical protein